MFIQNDVVFFFKNYKLFKKNRRLFRLDDIFVCFLVVDDLNKKNIYIYIYINE